MLIQTVLYRYKHQRRKDPRSLFQRTMGEARENFTYYQPVKFDFEGILLLFSPNSSFRRAPFICFWVNLEYRVCAG